MSRHIPVTQVMAEYGPFLPYSVLFGLPLEDENPFPFWTNLLQKGLSGWGYWGTTLESAVDMARAGALSLALTSSPRQVAFWCIGPRAEELADFRLPQGHVLQVRKEEDVMEVLHDRRYRGYRGPQHIVVFLTGRVSGKTIPLFDYGPVHALWPVPVEPRNQARLHDQAQAFGLLRVIQVSRDTALLQSKRAAPHRIQPLYPA